MQNKHWKINLNKAVDDLVKKEIIKKIFNEFLNITYKIDWKGACHESSSAIYVLLKESGINCKWKLGEAKANNYFFDHSWIEIDGKVFDIAITKTLQEEARNAPIINDIDIETNKVHNIEYGAVSGYEFSQQTILVENINLSEYLSNSPISPIGTWAVILDVAKKQLNLNLDLQNLISKYQGKFYEKA